MSKPKSRYRIIGTPTAFYIYDNNRKGFDCFSGWILGDLNEYYNLKKMSGSDFESRCNFHFEGRK